MVCEMQKGSAGLLFQAAQAVVMRGFRTISWGDANTAEQVVTGLGLAEAVDLNSSSRAFIQVWLSLIHLGLEQVGGMRGSLALVLGALGFGASDEVRMITVLFCVTDDMRGQSSFNQSGRVGNEPAPFKDAVSKLALALILALSGTLVTSLASLRRAGPSEQLWMQAAGEEDSRRAGMARKWGAVAPQARDFDWPEALQGFLQSEEEGSADATSRRVRSSLLESAVTRKMKPLPAKLVRSGHCVHVPALGSSSDDANLVNALLEDIEKAGSHLKLHRSRRHMQMWGEHLAFSKTFTAVVARLVSLFGLSMVDCWVNVYRNGEEQKAPHQDNYKDRSPRPSATIGLSLGAARPISFKDRFTGETFRIKQKNGDVFAFDTFFNDLFTHSIPPSNEKDDGVRLSIIIWAVEGDGSLAVPTMRRQGRGFPTPEEVKWTNWDLTDGLWSAQFAESHAQASTAARSHDERLRGSIAGTDSQRRLPGKQHLRKMSAETQMRQFELKLKKAIERVKLVLEAEKKPQLPVDVHHSYEDKFTLLERGSCLAVASLANSLEQLGLGGEKLAQLQTWAAANAVSLRFKSKETCQFLREVTRDEESPTKRVNEVQVGGVAFGSFTSKTVTKVTEFFWKFDMAYELEAIRGVGADDSDRLLICSRSGHVELKTSTKSSPHPETKVSTCEEVNISFLLKQLLGSPATPAFKIDRLSPKCRTPRRNPEVQEAVNFGRSYLTWICKVSKYFERLHRLHPQRSTTPTGSSDLFVPALPLFIKGSAKAGSSASGGQSLVLLGEDAEVAKHVVTAADGNRLLGEESRALGEQRANLMEVFPDDGSIYTWMESFRALILQHSQQVVVQWSEMIEYVEHMLRMQLVAAIGKEVRPAEFASYMRFHYRKLFREAYQPTPCSFAIRRSTKHGPEGTISIEEEALGLQDESSIKSPICAITAAGRTPSTMTFPLNASTTISFGGQVHLHAWLDHQFSGQSSSKLSLVSRARQFSSFMVLIGRVSSSTTFDPKYAALVQNKDELEIPLELSTIPTPKEFKDAIESLSPEQQEFAKAFRAMQLESTLFAVLVVQIKPQLEKLLNLADDSLTKEIKLTQDLMQLFIKYQIPSDLLSFTSDLLPNGHGSAGERLQVVKGQ
ncbi:unnamed protein product, partial [Symbiodinium necroappetens]